jgi:hypothetical protein
MMGANRVRLSRAKPELAVVGVGAGRAGEATA